MAPCPLAGQTAIVTGAGRGIGRAIALALAGAGARVATVARTAVDVQETASQIAAAGGEAAPFCADVTDRGAVERMADAVAARLGPVHILVNNAGTHVGIGHLWEVDPDLWWRDVEVNLRGTFLSTRAVLPAMIARGRGCIINLVSGAALEPRPQSSAYAGAKAAAIRLTDSLAADVGPLGIRVFALHPGGVYTPLTEAILASNAGRAAYPHWRTRDWLPPERAASVVVALAAGEADALAGRYIDAAGDIAAQVAAVEQAQNPDLFMLRLITPENDS